MATSAERAATLRRVRGDGYALAHAAESLKAEKDIVLAAVAQNGWALQFAADALRFDKEVTVAAVRQCGTALRFAAEVMRADKEVVMVAVAQDWTALRYAAEVLKRDRDVVAAAGRQDGAALYYADEALLVDRDVVMTAVTEDGRALCHASEELQSDVSFLDELLCRLPPATFEHVLLLNVTAALSGRSCCCVLNKESGSQDSLKDHLLRKCAQKLCLPHRSVLEGGKLLHRSCTLLEDDAALKDLDIGQMHNLQLLVTAA